MTAPDAKELSAQFVSHLPSGRRDEAARLGPGLERQLQRLLRLAAEAEDGQPVEPRQLLAHVARTMPAQHEVLHTLQHLRVEDLALAMACARGDAPAMAALERRHFDVVDAALARLPDAASRADEIKQQLRDVLFVGTASRGAKIGQYSGRGDLRNWLRITTTRTALNLLKKHRREVELKDEVLDNLASPDENQELEFLKGRYRAQFKRAFGAALSSLSSRERNILRYHYLDRLSIDQIGSIHGVHRATAARWLARIRDLLLARTREALMEQLRISRDEFDSIMRLIESRLDASIERHLPRQ